MRRQINLHHLIIGVVFLLGLNLPLENSAAEPETLNSSDLVFSDAKSILADTSVPGHSEISLAFDRSNPGDRRREAFGNALRAGHPLALYLVAEKAKTQDEQLDLYARAADGGYRSAAFKIGDVLYQHGRGDRENFSRALAAFYPAAEAGEPSAQFYLGRMYQLGHGTKIDGAKAAKWYILAGENGQARAWNNLGNVYADGLVEVEDNAAILTAYRKASDMGMAMGSYNAGRVYHFGKHGLERNLAKAAHFYRLTLEQYPDYPGAWNHLGNVLRAEGPDWEPDYAGAENAFMQGVRLGELHAMYNLADLYYTGKRPAEPDRVVELLQRAADQGHVFANRRLGFMYETGKLVAKNTERAVHHYSLAAAEGNASAQNSLAVLLVRSKLEAADAPRVIELLEASAKSGSWHAMANLGSRIAYGRVAGEDPSRGIELLEAAANRGLVNAINRLCEISEKPEWQHVLSMQQREKWMAERERLKAEAQKAASLDLSKVAPLLETASWETALAQIDEAFDNWNHSANDTDSYLGRLWWDAQTQQGRVNPEWSSVLFEWIDRAYAVEQGLPGARLSRLIVCLNRSSALRETGRLVQHRALARRTENLLIEIEGIDVRQIVADFQEGLLEELPLSYSSNWESFLVSEPEPENSMSYAVMLAFLTLSVEHYHQAQWGEAELFLDWIERWTHSAAAEEISPFATNAGHVQLVSVHARLLRAQIEEIRGDGRQALALYDSLINEAPELYGKKYLHQAIARRAFLLASLEQWDLIDTERLADVEKLQADNDFARITAPDFTRLARAEALHGRGLRDEGFVLVFEVIQSTQGKERPFLRLRALETASRMALREGDFFPGNHRTVRVEEWLTEALELIRDKGLKAREPDFYEYYAQWQGLLGNTLQSAKIHQKQLRLLQSLGLDERAAVVSETIVELSSVAGDRKNIDVTPSIDLQPKYISSVPMPGLRAQPVFTLSNLQEHPVKVFFSLSGATDYATDLEGGLVQLSLIPGTASNHQETEIELAGFEQLLLQVNAPTSSIVEEGSEIFLKARTLDGRKQIATLNLSLDAAEIESAVVDASEILFSPFYWVPVFHNLAAIVDVEDPRRIAFRVRATHPTRIEVYNSDGKLLFVDAKGDGLFVSAGDMILTEQVYQDYPVFLLEHVNRRLEFRYQPIHPHPSEPIRIFIERAQITGGSILEWVTDVEDHIRFED